MGFSRVVAVFITVPVSIGLLSHLTQRFYLAGSSCPSRARLDGKTVVITGANTGIGKTAALDFATRGARVILACRDEAKASRAVEDIVDATQSPDVIFMKLDLSSFASVKSFAEEFLRTESRLDVLVNNAGLVGPPDPRLNENGLEMTLMVNHLGHFYLTQLLLDRLKDSGPGSRIVSVSSKMYNFANPNAFIDLEGSLKKDGVEDYPSSLDMPDLKGDILWKILPQFASDYLVQMIGTRNVGTIRYSNSKLANILHVRGLARKLKGSGVNSYVVHPGMVNTEFGVSRDRPELGKIGGFFALSFLRKTATQGAQTTICCAVSEEFKDQSGLYYDECEPFDVKRAEVVDEAMVERFWNWSEGVVAEATAVLAEKTE